MKYLLDTHTLLWWDSDPRWLSSTARDLLEDPANSIWCSALSAWELGIKYAKGKLPVAHNLIHDWDYFIREYSLIQLPFSAHHALTGASLPHMHLDPFDRGLAAQAITEGMVVITKDVRIAELGAEVVW